MAASRTALNIRNDENANAGMTGKRVLRPRLGAVSGPAPATEKPAATMRRQLGLLNIQSDAPVPSKPAVVPSRRLTPVSHQADVPDPEAQGFQDEFQVATYVKDIMAYLRDREYLYAVPRGFLDKCAVSASNRRQLVDWIIVISEKFKTLNETLYLTLYMLDAYCARKPASVTKANYQLIGVAAFFLASKFEEIYPPSAASLVTVASKSVTCRQIFAMERDIYRALEFDINRPLPCHFLRRASKVGDSTVEHHAMAKFLIEMASYNPELVAVAPSRIAAAALALSQELIETPKISWTPALERYTYYTRGELQPTVIALARAYEEMKKSRFQTVIKKYAAEKHQSISLYSGLHKMARLAAL